MEKTRNFFSANDFIVAMNFWSGNIFPLGDEDKNLGVVSIIWVIIVWSIKISYVLTVLLGSLYFADLPAEEVFKKTGAMGVLLIEVAIPTVYLNLRRKEFRDLINEYNSILIDSDDLRKCLRDTVEPYRRGLKLYMIIALCVSPAWSIAPVFKFFETDRFTYADFTIPAYLPGEPFGAKIFIAGILLQIFGSCVVNVAKISIDAYVSYFIAILSAQYKYLRVQTAKALSRENDQEDELSVVSSLQNCVRHHSAVIEIGQRLAELLALHIGATYLTCIFKFCFLAFGVATFESAHIEKASYLVYALVCVMQLFLLCSCIQELLDVSTSVTEDAFHENWHSRGIVVKKIFCTMEMSNQMECRLSAYGVVDLVVPTLAMILNKSYSVCLLLLKVD